MEHQGSESSDTSQHIADIIQHPDLVEYFYQAVERGYDKAVKELLDQFTKEERSLIVNKKYTNKGKCFVPMLTACEKGHLDVINALLSNGGSIEKHNKLGLNCLHIACEAGNLEIVKLLCERYSNNRKSLLDAKSLNTWTPLMFAIKGKHTTIINYLMTLPEVTIDSVTKKGRNVLHIAAQYSLECLNVLQSSHLVSSDMFLATDMQGWGVLHCACTSDSDNTDTLKWLLELRTNKGAVLNTRNYPNASKDVLAPTDEGYSNELPLLFGEKLNEKTKNDYTPLLVACEYKHKNMVQYFLELKMIGNRIVECKEHVSKGTPIVDASVFISTDDSSVRMTGLHISAVHDTPDIAELLIKHGCPTIAQDSEGDTALHIARRRSSFEVEEVITQLNKDSTLHEKKNKNNEKADEISSEEVIPVEILRRGPETVRNYHKALKDGKRKINECMLVVLGEARVGKTSLLRNMTGLEFEPNLDPTHGIENQCIETMIDSATIEIGCTCNCNWKRIDEKEQANKHVQAFVGTVKHLFETDNKESSNGATIQITEDELLHKIRAYLENLRISREIKDSTGKINVPTKDQVKQNTSVVKDDSEPISNSHPNLSDNLPNQTPIKPRMDPESSVVAEAKKDAFTLPQSDKQNTGPQPSNLPVAQRIGFGRRDALNMKSLACTTEPTLCLNALDFAGQKEYRPMHHCFMSRRAIYVVVCNLQNLFNKKKSETIEDLKYWLNSIHAHVHNPGYKKYIFLVGTHKNPGNRCGFIVTDTDLETLSHDLESELFKGDCCFKDEIHFFRNLIITGLENSVADKCSSGIEVIKNEIREFSTNLPFLAETHPVSWLNFRAKLLKLKSSNRFPILLSEAERMAKDCGVSESSVHIALQFFHDSGLIIYPAALKGIFLEDSEKDQIKAIVLVEPRWLIDIMKTVMEVEKANPDLTYTDVTNIQTKGRTTAKSLFQLWKNDHRGNHNDFKLICLLVRAHGLMQAIKSSDKLVPKPTHASHSTEPPLGTQCLEFIIPCMLSNKEPEFHFEGYTFYFDFKGFLPQEVFHCLICLVIKKCQEPPPKCWANACIWYCMEGYDWEVQLLSGEHKLKVVANPLEDESERLNATKCVDYFHEKFIRPICEQSGLPGLSYVAGPLVNSCKKKKYPLHSAGVLSALSYPTETSWPVKCKECGTEYTYDDISKLLNDSLQSALAANEKSDTDSKRQQIAALTPQMAYEELKDVVEWDTIGQKLVGDVMIANIKSDNSLKDMLARKREMLRIWLNNDRTATWCKLAQALEGTYGVCAHHIHHKYCGMSE